MSARGVRREKAALSSGCKSHPATAPAGSNRSSHGGNEVAEAFDCSKRDRIQRTQGVWLQVCGAQDGLRGAKPSSWVGCYHRNDRHGEQRRPEPKPLLLASGSSSFISPSPLRLAPRHGRRSKRLATLKQTLDRQE